MQLVFTVLIRETLSKGLQRIVETVVNSGYQSCQIYRISRKYKRNLEKISKIQSGRFSCGCSIDGVPCFLGGVETVEYDLYSFLRLETGKNQTIFRKDFICLRKRNTQSKQDTFEKIFSCPACILLLRHNAHTQNGKIVNFYKFIFLFDFMSQKLFFIHIKVEGKKHKVPKENLPDQENQQ